MVIIGQAGAKRFVYNAERSNRVRRSMNEFTSTGTWAYSTNTWRQAEGAAGNKVEWVDGLGESMLAATLSVAAYASSSNVNGSISIGIDQITAADPSSAIGALVGVLAGGPLISAVTANNRRAGRGYHYAAWLEKGNGTGTSTWKGRDTDRASGMAASVEL